LEAASSRYGKKIVLRLGGKGFEGHNQEDEKKSLRSKIKKGSIGRKASTVT
jgi:hypothetical protein